jgi:hypothetical protein
MLFPGLNLSCLDLRLQSWTAKLGAFIPMGIEDLNIIVKLKYRSNSAWKQYCRLMDSAN